MNADPQPCRTGNRYRTSVKDLLLLYNFAIDFTDSRTQSCTGTTGTNNREDICPHETSTHSLLCYKINSNFGTNVQNSRKMEDPDQHQTARSRIRFHIRSNVTQYRTGTALLNCGRKYRDKLYLKISKASSSESSVSSSNSTSGLLAFLLFIVIANSGNIKMLHLMPILKT
jgi:hypothetical protein